MSQDTRYEATETHCKKCFCSILWKRAALAVITLALLLGSAGCALDDLMTPFAGDIPFEQETTAPSEIGAVDNTPTVPEDDSSFGDIDFRPF